MFLFLLFQNIHCTDYSKGYKVLEKPGNQSLTIDDKSVLRILKMPMPKKESDKNLLKFEKKGDKYAIKFVHNGKYVCRDLEKPQAKMCDNGDDQYAQFVIENKGGDQKRLVQKEKCLARSGRNEDYLAFVNCGTYPNRQVWMIKDSDVKPTPKPAASKPVAPKPAAPVTKPKPAATAEKPKPAAPVTKPKAAEPVATPEKSDISTTKPPGKKSSESTSTKTSSTISTPSIGSKSETADIVEPSGVSAEAISEEGPIVSSEDISGISGDQTTVPSATLGGSGPLKTTIVQPTCMPACAPACCMTPPSLCSGGIIPNEQYIISDSGVEKVDSGIDAVKKAMKDVGSGGGELNVPTEGKTTRIVRIV